MLETFWLAVVLCQAWWTTCAAAAPPGPLPNASPAHEGVGEDVGVGGRLTTSPSSPQESSGTTTTTTTSSSPSSSSSSFSLPLTFPPSSSSSSSSPLHLLFYSPTPPIPTANAEFLCTEALNEAGRNIARRSGGGGDLRMGAGAEEYYAQGDVELVIEPGAEMTWLMEWEVPGALRGWLEGNGFRGTRFGIFWGAVEVGRGRITAGKRGLDGG